MDDTVTVKGAQNSTAYVTPTIILIKRFYINLNIYHVFIYRMYICV